MLSFGFQLFNAQRCTFALYSPTMKSMASQPLTVARPVSPWLEMGAYEWLWTKSRQTFKGIADLFRGKDDAVPSDFVFPAFAEQYARDAIELLSRARVTKFGIRLHGTGDYPNSLRDAKNPIELFYFQGWWDLLSTKSVAVVGTRKPSEDGISRAEKLVRNLVEDNFTIVSGLAAGIDTAAHKAAIKLKGRTIGVIGTPLSRAYPPENADLQQQIAREFLLISQVPVIQYERQDWRFNRMFFPQRNVTMSALTLATVIVEASDTSGTLMQARAAIQQKRKLFILDSCFRDAALTWPARFEKMGAIRVRDYEDIRKNLAHATPTN
jgi:DNA processing protein